MLTLDTLAVALAVSAASVTTARSSITEAPRAWITARVRWLGHLVGCPYCISHWYALAGGLWLPWATPVHLLINVLALVALAALITGAAQRLLHLHELHIQKLERALDDVRDDLKAIIEAE